MAKEKTCIIFELMNTFGGRHIPTRCIKGECSKWDESRDCCSFNTKSRCETTHIDEYLVSDTLLIPQIKTNIDVILNEKTGWGRIELKRRLFDMLDSLPHISATHKQKDDTPF